MKNKLTQIIVNRLLNEEMISKIGEYKENINFYDTSNTKSIYTMISEDDVTLNRLILIVTLTKVSNILFEYSYGFMLIDKDGNKISDVIHKRNEVERFIPTDLKNQQKIFPIIIELTKKLMNRELPEKILRKTYEILRNDNSLTRYKIIGDFLVNEYGYQLEKEWNDRGINYWMYTRGDKNSEMSESYTISNLPTHEDTERIINNDFSKVKITFDKQLSDRQDTTRMITEELKNSNIKFNFK